MNESMNEVTTDLETLRRDRVMERFLDAMKAAGVPLGDDYIRYDDGGWGIRNTLGKYYPDNVCTLKDLDAAAFACVRWMGEHYNDRLQTRYPQLWQAIEGEWVLELGMADHGGTDRFTGPTPYHAVLAAMQQIGAKP